MPDSPENATPDPAPPNEPSGAERRRDERVPCQIPVRYRLKAQGLLTSWKDSEAGNISAGGIFMTFGEKIETGMLLELEIDAPGLIGTIKTLARVAWTKGGDDKVVQCGLEFAQIRPEDRVFLTRFIEKERGSRGEKI